MVVSRWRRMALPERFGVEPPMARSTRRNGFYDYADLPDPDAVHWHVNFADPHLFFAYGGPLFAQDEMQVAEHPVLASVREAMLAGGLKPLTVENLEPTPVLVMGAQRRCAVATDANPREGRPAGLYGSHFARASAAAVRRATRRIDPPTITNLIAMAALPCGSGTYTRHAIEHTLATAFTGFQAARLESAETAGQGRRVIVHTGYWGCGAFGGNRVLMVLLQLLAARLAGLDGIVFHTGPAGGERAYDQAADVVARDLPHDVAMAELVRRIEAMGFRWGASDGN